MSAFSRLIEVRQCLIEIALRTQELGSSDIGRAVGRFSVDRAIGARLIIAADLAKDSVGALG